MGIVLRHAFNISIIIPTVNHLENCLKPCIESILKYTDFSNLDIQIVIIANGSDEDTIKYLQELYQKYISFINIIHIDQPIGFPKAINEGLKYSFGKYIVILNDDVELLHQRPNTWLNLLYKPFIEDPMMGITGCHSLICPVTNEEFILFFCAMIKREVFSAVGLLNEAFSPGYGEDIDFCIRAKKFGYSIRNVNTNIHYPNGKDYVVGDFPISHKGEMTVHDISNWEEIKQNNNELLRKFYAQDNIKKENISLSKLMEEKKITNENILITHINSNNVTVGISTKDRYNILPLALEAVINQTVMPKKIFIFDDSDNEIDIKSDILYTSLLHIMRHKNIEYEVLRGSKKGQVHNHQTCLELSSTEFIWRIDDDNIPEPNVLEALLNEMNKDKNIGAIGSLILETNTTNRSLPSFVTGDIQDIYFGLNPQWFIHKDPRIIETDHLHSSFLYRKRAGFPKGYCLELSRIGFREETIFTYEMKRNGWKLFIHPNVITWHLKTKHGGVRDLDAKLKNEDEALFYQKLTTEWNIKPRYLKSYVLHNGIGDHFMFKMLLPEIRKKYQDKYKIIIACCHPKVFSDIKNDETIQIVNVEDAINAFGSSCIQKNCVYTWCKKNNWDGSLLDAMRILYLGEYTNEENHNQSVFN